jgi:hypothetical protein
MMKPPRWKNEHGIATNGSRLELALDGVNDHLDRVAQACNREHFIACA